MSKKLLQLVILMLLFLTLPAAAFAASFNCAKASTRVEKMICGDPGLSALDEQLAKAYKAALASSADKNMIKEQQRNWLRVRDAMQGVPELTGIYQGRIQELRAMSEYSGGKYGPTENPEPAAQQPTQSASQAPQENRQNESTAAKSDPAQTAQPIQPVQASDSDQTSQAAQSSQPVQSSNPEKTDSKKQEANQNEKAPEKKSPPLIDESTRNWVIFFIVVGLMVTAIFMHSNKKMNVYVDYTDAGMCLATVIVPAILTMIIGAFTNNSSIVGTIVFYVLLAGFAFFPAKAAFVYNKSVPLMFLALFCKFATAILFVVGAIGAIACREDKKKGEPEWHYQERTKGNAIFVAILLAIVHAIYIYIVSKTVRIDEFSEEIFNLSFANRHDELMQRAALENESQ